MRSLHFPRWLIVSGLVASLIVVLSGCATPEKAQLRAKKKFAVITTTYPVFLADQCAEKYPVKQVFVRGKDSLIRVTDTLYDDTGGIIRDTVVDHDTIRITTIHQLPGKIINNTFIRTDTVYASNTAAEQACEMRLNLATENLRTEQVRADKYQGRSRKYFWILIAIAAGSIVWVYFKIRKPK